MQKQLGEILVHMGCVTAGDLQLALSQQRTLGLPLGRTLIRDHLCTETEVARALSVQSGLSFIDLDQERIDPAMAAVLPAKFARERRVVPLRLEHGRREVLHVAVAAPANLMTVDEVRAASGKARVVGYLASDSAIVRALWRVYQPRAGDAVAAGARQAPVMLYGFTHVELARLEKRLAEHGLRARAATPTDVLACSSEDLLIASLDTLEQLVTPQRRLPGTVIAVGESPERDFPRAQALGARGFVAMPIDVELLVRTLRRFRTPLA